jgi:hypothetical protein
MKTCTVSQAVIEKLIEISPQFYDKIPDPWENLIKIKISKDKSLSNINRQLLTNDLCMYAIDAGVSLYHIPKELQTPDLIRYAVSKNGSDIRYVACPTEELKLLAVKNEGSALHYIKYQTEAVKLAAIENSPDIILWIKNPTPQMRDIALKKDPSLIKEMFSRLPECEFINFIIRNKQTLHVHRVLIMSTASNQEKFHKLSDNVIATWIEYDTDIIFNIKHTRITENIAMGLVKSSGYNIKYVPDNALTETVCLQAVMTNPLCLSQIPVRFHTNAVCIKAISLNPKACKHIRLKKELWNDDLILEYTINNI